MVHIILYAEAPHSYHNTLSLKSILVILGEGFSDKAHISSLSVKIFHDSKDWLGDL